ncbi:MAG TPA: hypothetical protein VLF67_03185 [Candidatus Saccharimonas sp.]|nr:hypothetical protein [Candidatus Saccharimonas sp.]
MRIQLADVNASVVVQFPYRTAMVGGSKAERHAYTRGDEFHTLHQALAAATGTEVGNHQCYRIRTLDGLETTGHVMFSDWQVTFGDTLVQGKW